MLNGGAGSDTASYADQDTAVGINLAVASNAGDTFTSIENVIGSQGNDSMTGSGATNALDGQGGNDTLSGAGGIDLLMGGQATTA